MSVSTAAGCAALEARARQSLGSSSDAIHRMVASALARHDLRGALAVDVGCGRGALAAAVAGRYERYCGLDAVQYPGFPPHAEFLRVDFDAARWPVAPACADLVAAVETIEHLENPWAFVRHLAGIAVPGGWVLVTTPNQLSLLSVLTLIARRRFSAFQDAHYPAHLTALLEVDLRRAFAAAGLDVVEVAYSLDGRLPWTAWHYPRLVTGLAPRALSDNLMIVGRKPRG